MGLVDDQIRRTMRATLQAMLDDWSDLDVQFEHTEDQVFYWTTRHTVPDELVPGVELHVTAAFLISDEEQEAKDWYVALDTLPERGPG